MRRNCEIKMISAVFVGVVLLFCILIHRYPGEREILGFGMGLCLACIFFSFTLWRYRKIRKLADYLRKILNGNYGFDIRDNKEGELSFLKNEIYKVTQRLLEQTELLKKDKNYLADAISDISHQLKTPLTSITVMADVLNDVDLPPAKRKEFTDNIHKQLERMEWLVTTLLKMSKLDANAVLLKKERVNVKELVEKSAVHLLIPMELKNQEFIVEGESEVFFTGDFSWLLEAVSNILKNCMEHTPCGGKIKVSYKKNLLYTGIIIEDNGEGMEKEELPHIFERFYKGKNAGPDSVGIGLPLAKQIICLQNGTIEAESEKNQGTRFNIKFYERVI